MYNYLTGDFPFQHPSQKIEGLLREAFWIMLVFVSTALLKDAKLQKISLALCCQICRVTEEA